MIDITNSPGPVTRAILRLEDEPLLDEVGLTSWLGISPKTSQAWRAAGKGPQFVRLPASRLVRYRPADVRAWLAAGNGGNDHG
jgi:predicted DNA-binding transcriptional regulator AlpA